MSEDRWAVGVTIQFEFGQFRAVVPGRSHHSNPVLEWPDAVAIAEAIEPWCPGAPDAVRDQIRKLAAESEEKAQRAVQQHTDSAIALGKARSRAEERRALADALAPVVPVELDG